MGINGLWEVLGEGEARHIADFAAEHFKKHGKPLRIAVDEACWRFTNLTTEQVEKIREGEPAANPVERTILWGILRLWRLNIQLLFVWDGLRKPGKGRGGGGKVDRNSVELLHRMFEILKVPYHQAPGEAEAECARLEKAGVVDAVWSDDGDSFMFGCQTLIKQHKVNGKRITDHVRIYRADTIAREKDLDGNSFVLFAVLAGGDYDKAGLPGCGPAAAKWVAKRSRGLAKDLVEASDHEMPAWRSLLGNAVRKDIPSTFPNMKALNGYRRPAVSSEEACHSRRRLRNGFDIKFDQAKARVELRERYHFTTREYLKHLAPILLIRKLARLVSPSQREENLRYDVKLKPTRVKRPSDEGAPAKTEVKITFAAAMLVDIDLTTIPPEEDWDQFAAKDGTPYSPMQNIEGEVLHCFLEHGLPSGSFDAPVKLKKSRTSSKKAAEGDEQPPKSQEKESVDGVSSPATASKKRKRPSKSSAGTEQDADAVQTSSKKQGRSSRDPSGSTKVKRKDVVDLCDSEGDDDAGHSEGGLFLSPGSPPPAASKTRLGPAATFRPLRPLSLPQDAKVAQVSQKSSTPKAPRPPQKVGTKVIAQTAQKSAPRKRATQCDELAAANVPTVTQDSTPPTSGAASGYQIHTSPGQDHAPQLENTVPTAEDTGPLPAALIPGETITPATLRELRAASSHKLAATTTGAGGQVAVSSPVVRQPTPPREVIDLT